MTALSAGANLAAIHELKHLFCAADPARTGLLSYSEFAYTILRSGGTQEQVDALVEQFSAPPRAKRMVCYVALLDQLYDSIEAATEAHNPVNDGGVVHSPEVIPVVSPVRRTTSTSPVDTSEHSPLPIPPRSNRIAPPSWNTSRRSPSVTGHTFDATAFAPISRCARSAHQQYLRQAASSSPSFDRSVTHPDSRDSGTAIHASRASSIEACATYSAHPKRPLRLLCSNDSVASSHTPFRSQSTTCSSRFLESALGIAWATASLPPTRQKIPCAPSQAGTRASESASRSPSHEDVHGTSLEGPSAVRARDHRGAFVHDAISAPRHTADTAQYPRYPLPPNTECPRREGSTERMTRVAAEVCFRDRQQPPLKTEGSSTGAGQNYEGKMELSPNSTRALRDASIFTPSLLGPRASSLQPATPKGITRPAAPQSKITKASPMERCTSESRLRNPDDMRHRGDSGLIAAVPLLSLRDIFQRYLAPSSRDGTVLLSELQEALTTHGVDVHPLELEAVADSLELRAATVSITPNESSLHSHSLPKTLNSRMKMRVADDARLRGDSSHGWPSGNAADMNNAGPSTTMAIHELTTVTGSRDLALSLVDFCVLISRLRPALIHRIRSASVWESAPSIGETEVRQSSQPPPDNPWGGACGTGSVSNGDSDDGASIEDVTVSPMTPATAPSATPKSAASSPSPTPSTPAPRQLQRQRLRLAGTHSADPHRPRDAISKQSTALWTSSSAAHPTARQLSNDRQFSVDYAWCQSQSGRVGEEKYDHGCSSERDAQPTAASQQRHKGLRMRSIKAAVPRRSKVPVWHEGVRAGKRRTHSSTAPSPTSASPSSLWSLTSPDEHNAPHQSQPRRTNISLEGASRDGASPPREEPYTPSSTAVAPRLAPHVLGTLQCTALALLRRCTEIDRRRTGYISPSAWRRVLREASPSLTDAEQFGVLEWVEARGHRSADGDDYRAVVEDMLAEADGDPFSPTSGIKRTPVIHKHETASPSLTQSRATLSRYTSQQQDAGSTRASNSPMSTTAHAAPPFHRHTAASRAAVPKGPCRGMPAASHIDTTARVEAVDHTAEQRLAHELMTACGGDTEALLEYFRAFDKSDTGFINEHVWRSSLEELFRRTEERNAPAWVVGECMRLSRVPLELHHISSSSSKSSNRMSASCSLSAEHAFLSQVPPATRRALCSYRYVLEKLGFIGNGSKEGPLCAASPLRF